MVGQPGDWLGRVHSYVEGGGAPNFHLADGHCSYEVHHGILADFLSFPLKGPLRRTEQCIARRLLYQLRPSDGGLSSARGRNYQSQCTALANANAKDTHCKDTKEAVPIPLAVIVAWEKAVCDATAPSSVKLFLGTALLCTHASVRFGDIQRAEWLSLQLSASAWHGSCRASKTTQKGQPFACAWHGLTGRNAETSWVLQWLSELAKFIAPRPGTAPGPFSPADTSSFTAQRNPHQAQQSTRLASSQTQTVRLKQ